MYFKKIYPVTEKELYPPAELKLKEIDGSNVAIMSDVEPDNCLVFRDKLSQALQDFSKQYSWFSATGNMYDLGIKHVVVSIPKTQDYIDPLDELLVPDKNTCYPFVSTSFISRPGVYEVIYFLSTESSTNLLFPGSYDKSAMSIKEGGLVIFPSSLGFSPVLEVINFRPDSYIEYLKCSLFIEGSNPELESKLDENGLL